MTILQLRNSDLFIWGVQSSFHDGDGAAIPPGPRSCCIGGVFFIYRVDLFFHDKLRSHRRPRTASLFIASFDVESLRQFAQQRLAAPVKRSLGAAGGSGPTVKRSLGAGGIGYSGPTETISRLSITDSC